MKYLVTGGAGFIGSNLVEELVKKGNEIVVIDDLSTGSLNNLAALRGGVELIKADVGGSSLASGLNKLDGIFHLGIPSSMALYRADRDLVGRAVGGFIKIMELAKANNCKLVYASTASIYNGNKNPYTEDMPVLVKDFYSEARYAMERLARLYHDFYGVRSVGLRFFSVYGPHEEAKKNLANVVSQFMWAMKKGEAPVIYGDGRQARDYVFVKDIVGGLILAMESDIGCDIFNLGTGKTNDFNRVVRLLNQALGTNIIPVYQKNPYRNYIDKTQADTKKAKDILGWEFSVSLGEGIKRIL